MTSSTDRGPWLQTYTGRAFYPLDPRPEDVDVEDICHALAHQCRFAGHSKRFYSVAEHTLRVADMSPRSLTRVALLHDAAEAYTIDLPRPLKMAQGAEWYRDAEKRVTRAIGEHFGVELDPLPPEVKHADAVLLATEKRDLMGPAPQPWDWLPEPYPMKITACSPPPAVWAELLADAIMDGAAQCHHGMSFAPWGEPL